MDRDAILKRLTENRGNCLRLLDRQFIAMLQDRRYPDVSLKRWLDLKADYRMSLIKDGILEIK